MKILVIRHFECNSSTPTYDVIAVKTSKGSGEMFTKWPGVRLEHYVILTLPTETCVSTCILNCITTPDCFSVNFWKLTGLCELNSYNIMLSRLKVADNCIHYSLDSVQ